ncbi:Zn-ribbon domain-containing OB-fold protein [Nonomuraea sp. 10N515B]|uniref:Zn-ribbon domain-containing OB-fold protein n=1 Tax=Nonomuraea sp. 10N515B TaxID=3457422 RepID=UPI003FCC7351
MAYRPEPDRDSREWWERIAGHEFAVQRCDTCGTTRFPARAFCPACRSEACHWQEVEPEGRVESWIVNHQAFVPGRRQPYVVVMVRLAAVPGCLVYGNWHGDRPPEPGERVRASYDRIDETLTLVNWTPAGSLDPHPHQRTSFR